MSFMVIKGRPSVLSPGLTVSRLLPFRNKRMVGPFIFWDHLKVDRFTGEELVVLPHPHIGLSTLTYLTEGAMLHRDSLGYEVPIVPGEVNWMCSGKGVVHSERTEPVRHLIKDGKMMGIQSWVALPKHLENCEPSFHNFRQDQIPVIAPSSAISAELRLVVGSALGHSSPVPVHSPLFYLSGSFEAGARFSMRLEPSHEGAVYPLTGSVRVRFTDTEALTDTTLNNGEMGVWGLGQVITFDVLETSQLKIFGGEPFPEQRHIFWNFVSSDPNTLEQAKSDWQMQTDRFAKVVNETEFIPLPVSKR